MNGLLEVRRVQPGDFNAVWQLHNEALDAAGAHGGNGPWDDDVADPIASYVAQGGEFLVATESARLVGMVGLKTFGGGAFEIKRMRVHPNSQRRGIGTALLKAIEQVAVDLGAAKLVLDTTTLQIAAQRFYEQHGYAEVRRSQSGRFELVHYEKSIRDPS